VNHSTCQFPSSDFCQDKICTAWMLTKQANSTSSKNSNQRTTPPTKLRANSLGPSWAAASSISSQPLQLWKLTTECESIQPRAPNCRLRLRWRSVQAAWSGSSFRYGRISGSWTSSVPLKSKPPELAGKARADGLVRQLWSDNAESESGEGAEPILANLLSRSSIFSRGLLA